MFETTQKVTKNDVVYEYPAIKTAVRIKGKHTTFLRTYGNKRTKAEAIKEVSDWKSEQQ